MRKFISKYKQFIWGTIFGAVGIVVFSLWNFGGGEPYQDVPYVIRDMNGDTLVQTPKFSIYYQGVSGVNVASSMTIAGRHGDIKAPWFGGYISGENGGNKGIEEITLYDTNQGIGTMYVRGRIFRVKNNATQLQVADLYVDLNTPQPPFVVVNKDGYAHIANSTEQKKILSATSPDNLEYGATAVPQL